MVASGRANCCSGEEAVFSAFKADGAAFCVFGAGRAGGSNIWNVQMGYRVSTQLRLKNILWEWSIKGFNRKITTSV